MSGTNKKTRGRQKIEMKKIENPDDRLITFSKRRSGIYKKANEIAVLCGAEIGFIVLSPAGKPFSFGHPSLESVANRFLNQNPNPNDNNTHPVVEARRKIRSDEIRQHLNELLSQIEEEEAKAKALDTAIREKESAASHGWWEAPIDQLNQVELRNLYSSFEELRNNLRSKMNNVQRMSGGASSSSLLVPQRDPAQFINPFPSS